MTEHSASLVRQIARAYGIQADIDADIGETPVRFDVEDVGAADALRLLGLVTRTLPISLGSCRIHVVTDSPVNREKYLPRLSTDVSLAKLSPEEVKGLPGLVQTIFGDEVHAKAVDGTGTLAINALASDYSAFTNTINQLYRGSSALQLDVAFYEVSRTNRQNSGAILPNSASVFNVQSEANGILASNAGEVQQIIASGLANPGDSSAILAILIASGYVSGTVFNSPFVVFGGGITETGVEWNTTMANLLLGSSESRSLEQLSLQLADEQQGTFRLGERYPIKLSSYTTASTTSSTTTSIPQVQYQDLGLTVRITPWIGSGEHIGLDFDLTLRSLAGSSINGIPVLNNRHMSGLVTVRPGDSALIVSTMSSQELLAMTGYPLPAPMVDGATNRDHSSSSEELVVVITPRVLHIAHGESASPMIILPSN